MQEGPLAGLSCLSPELPMRERRSLLAMFDSFPKPRHIPCPDCGASVPVRQREHVCDGEVWATYQLFQLRDKTAAFDDQLAFYLDSPRGRFELWDAARRRHG